MAVSNPAVTSSIGSDGVANNPNLGTPGAGGNVQSAIGMAEAGAQKRREESVMFSNAMQQIAQDTEHMRKGLEQTGKAIFAETRTG